MRYLLSSSAVRRRVLRDARVLADAPLSLSVGQQTVVSPSAEDETCTPTAFYCIIIIKEKHLCLSLQLLLLHEIITVKDIRQKYLKRLNMLSDALIAFSHALIK